MQWHIALLVTWLFVQKLIQATKKETHPSFASLALYAENPLGSSVESRYNDVIIGVMASQITSLTIVYSTVYSGAYQSKHQSYTLLAFVRGIHRRPVNSPHKGPVRWKMFPFDDVIMCVHVMMSSWKNNPHRGKGINNTYIHALVQACSISIANALETLQSYTKSSVWH